MKQNTKFLWMYVCILFSFAVILIIFAGLSTNKDIQEEKGLTNKIQIVSDENNLLKKENEDLKKKLNEANSSKEELVIKIDSLTNENKNLTDEKNSKSAVNALLDSAATEFSSNNKEKASEYLSKIDISLLSYSQKYLYDYLLKEITN